MTKKNDAYWIKRQSQWLDNQDKMDAAVTNRLTKEYQRTAKELEKEIASYFKRYGQDDVIEFRTMLQDLSDSDRDMLFQDMEVFAMKYPEYAHLMPVRESVYRLNRLQGLHYSTQLKLLELGAIEQKELEKHLEATYGKRYKEMMKELGIGNSFLSVDDELMRSTIYTKWINDENFSDRIWNNKEKLLNHLQTKYRDSLARGDNYRTLMLDVMERFSVGAFDARRLVWTEANFVYNQSHARAYVDAGIERYKISAIQDSKTSRICRDLDGKVFRFDEMEVGTNFPPFHSFCRTTFIGDMGEVEETTESKYDSTKDAFADVRYSGIEKELAKEIDAQYLDLANTYPIDTKAITLRSLKVRAGTVGYHRYGFTGDSTGKVTFINEIVLSNRYYKDKPTIEGLKEYIADTRNARNRNSHFLATVDHEYAHAIDTAYVIRKANLSEAIQKWDGKTYRIRADMQEINKINETLGGSEKHLSHDLKNIMKQEYDIKSDREFYEKVRDELGTYAATNEKEFLAEGFSAYRHIPKEEQTEFLQKFGEHFEKLFWEVF